MVAKNEDKNNDVQPHGKRYEGETRTEEEAEQLSGEEVCERNRQKDKIGRETHGDGNNENGRQKLFVGLSPAPSMIEQGGRKPTGTRMVVIVE